MSVLIFAENWDGKFKKSTYEAISYGAELAKQAGGAVTAVVIGNVSDDDMKSLGKYGAQKVLSVKNDKLNVLNPSAYASAIAQAAQKESAKIIVVSYTYSGRSVAGRVAAKLKAVKLSKPTAAITVMIILFIPLLLSI